MCVSNQVEQFPAGYFRAGSALQASIEACPKCGEERVTALHSLDVPLECAHLRALNGGGLGPGLWGGDSGNGRHDRPPFFSAQSKGYFRPKTNFEQKLIYIYHR